MARSRPSARIRKIVFDRAKGCCDYCRSQSDFSPQPFSVEHIVPQSQGGSHEAQNLALACQGCNNYKFTHTTALDSISGQEVALFHPRQQNWSDHFQWNEGCNQLIGRTPTGRATVTCLKLNREGLVKLRKVLYIVGEHPPA